MSRANVRFFLRALLIFLTLCIIVVTVYSELNQRSASSSDPASLSQPSRSSSSSTQRVRSSFVAPAFPDRQYEIDDAVYHASLRAVHSRPISTVAEVLEGFGCFEFKQPGGQVQPETTYGETLYGLASLPDVRVAVETGTWDGSGSSKAIGMGLKNSEGILFTIEAIEEQWIHAQHNLAELPVKCLLGIGVESSELPTELDVENDGGVGDTPKEEWIAWLTHEKALSDSYPFGLIKPLCERYKVDLVHIDGGEFAGPGELQSVRKYCKHVRYIALDDVRMYKNKGNYKILEAAEDWEIFKEDLHERQGWAVFQRRVR